jgi:hypothetical protein
MGLFGNNKEKQLTERVDQALADDILSDEEQDQLFEFARSLGMDFNEYLNKHPATRDRVVIAGVNAGRFPGAAPPYHILVKPDEEVLIEGYASMLKQVGTEVIVTDDGVLSVTSTRIVFSGKTSTREITYDKVANLTVVAFGVTPALALAVLKGRAIDTQTYTLSNPGLFAAIIKSGVARWSSHLA